MDERMRRQWAAVEAKSYGWGGIRAVSGATGLSPNTIAKGLMELAVREENPTAVIEVRLRAREEPVTNDVRRLTPNWRRLLSGWSIPSLAEILGRRCVGRARARRNSLMN